MNFRSPSRGLLFVLILATAAVWVLASAAPPASSTGGIPAPQIGFQAPDISLPAEDGTTIQLADLRGRPVLVNFWASWCPPCRAEMPAMQQVYQELSSQGVTILAINAANQDDHAAALNFAQSLGLSFPIVYDQTGETSSRYAIRSLPTSFFVDSQGVIRGIIVGGLSEAALRIRLRQLLEIVPTEPAP